MSAIDEVSAVPLHVGLILDGNRRWAKKRGLPSIEGHRQGADVLQKVTSAAFERGVKYVSAYVFSTENWQRTQEEVSYLMKLVSRMLEKYLAEVKQEDIRIVVLGSREGLDKNVIKAIEKAESETATNTKGTIALCFNYGGQQEIVDAARTLVEKGTPAHEITAEALSGELYHPEIPPVDLMIRTSGEQRISNFMLWRVVYAELYFTNTYWPDFTAEHMDAALEEYAHRQRRYGT